MSNVIKTDIGRLLDLKRKTFFDDRGFFREVFHKDELSEILEFDFQPVQMNHSKSIPGVIRALHAEHWNKLVYPVTGHMFAALVDIRPDSPTFALVRTFEFNDDNRHALFVPEGVANSICVIGDKPVDYIYLVDKYYTGQDTTAIAWDDPDLNIQWPVSDPIISERDRKNPTLRSLYPHKFK